MVACGVRGADLQTVLEVLLEPGVVNNSLDSEALGGVGHEYPLYEVHTILAEIEVSWDSVADAHDALNGLTKVSGIVGVLEGVGSHKHHEKSHTTGPNIRHLALTEKDEDGKGGGEGEGHRVFTIFFTNCIERREANSGEFKDVKS